VLRKEGSREAMTIGRARSHSITHSGLNDRHDPGRRLTPPREHVNATE
jgi:hypothetical protein